MRNVVRISVYALGLILVCILGHIYQLTTISATETYPDDAYLNTEPDKNALIIVAHDDDMIGSCGTITRLCKSGWQIREMCFYQQRGLYAQKDSIKNPIRKRDLQRVAEIQGLSGVDHVDFNFRNDMGMDSAYMPMPYSKFADNFKLDSLRMIIASYIQKYKPSVIFTLDNVMGGYGNPDHVMISQLVLEYCKAHRNDPDFSVKKIYQPVFPPSLAENVLSKMQVYTTAKKVYQVSGMPLPDVQVDNSEFAELKKECLAAYTTEQNSIKNMWPYYNWYPSWIYFRIFDRDFFRVVDMSNMD